MGYLAELALLLGFSVAGFAVAYPLVRRLIQRQHIFDLAPRSHTDAGSLGRDAEASEGFEHAERRASLLSKQVTPTVQAGI